MDETPARSATRGRTLTCTVLVAVLAVAAFAVAGAAAPDAGRDGVMAPDRPGEAATVSDRWGGATTGPEPGQGAVGGLSVGDPLPVSPGGHGSAAGGVRRGDAELTDDGRYFVGQVLWTDAYDPGDEVQLRRADGTLVTQVPVGEDGVATLKTAGRVPGKYVLRAADGPELSFELVTQDYGVEVSSPVVKNAGTDATVAFRVESNRERYRQAITSPELSADALRSLFGTGTVTDADGDGSDELVVSGSVETTLSADFAGVEAGLYTFEFSVVDATAAATVTVEVEHAEPGRAVFVAPSKVVVEERGDVARVPVVLEGTDRATLTIGSDQAHWEVRLTAVDADGDGSVAVLVNTDLAGRVGDPARAFAAAGSDRLANVTRTAGDPFSDPNRRLAAGSYPLFFGVDGVETDVGTIRLRSPDAVERSVGVTRAARRLPRSAVLENASAGALALDSNVAVARGDHLVVGLRIAGVFGALQRAEAPANGTQGVSLRVVEESPGHNEEADAVDPGTFAVVPAPTENRIALVADTADPDFEVNATYRVTLTVDESNPYVEETVRRSATFTVVPRRVSVDAAGDRLRVQSVAGETVSGAATMADGTRLSVTLRSNGSGVEGARPFLRSKTVVVRNGTWNVTFDMSGVPTGQTFAAVVEEPGGASTRVRGVVTRPATVKMSSQPWGNPEVVTVDEAHLPAGGFVAIHGSDDGGPGSVLGSSGYLSPEKHEGIRVTLDEPIGETRSVIAIVYRDTDGDAVYDYVTSGGEVDTPYTVGGRPVSDTGQIQSEPTGTTATTRTATGTTPTGTTGTTRTTTAGTTRTTDRGTSPTSTSASSPTSTTTTETGDGDAPGFGIGVALLALLVSGLLAARRRD